LEPSVDHTPSLASFVAPVDIATFFASYWKKASLLSSGNDVVLDLATRALGGLELRDWLAAAERISIWPREQGRATIDSTSIEEGLRAYERGDTLYCDLSRSHEIGRWGEGLANALGEAFWFVHIFAVKSGGGTRPHFDRNQGFTLQVKGHKRWVVAPNGFIEHPTANWAIGLPPPGFVDPRRAPTKMPADSEVYTLRPGSILYTPRGFLHHVKAVDEGESLSLNFSFEDVPWMNLMMAFLQNLLLADPQMREGLTGVMGEGWGLDAFAKALPTKLERLRRCVQFLDPDLFQGLMARPDYVKSLLLALRQHSQ
jgi:hypothetical protein